MGQALILEVVDHRGRIRHRHRLVGPMTVGRAYDNDLIVDDPYVDPHHLRIEPNEAADWTVTDLGTRNGTWDARFHRRLATALLQPSMDLRLGRTTLRVLALDQAVALALPHPTYRTGLVNRLAEPKVALPIVGVAMVIAGIARFLSSTSDQELAQLATPGLAFALVASIWALGWAFTNRIVAHRFRFVGHLGWTMTVGIGGLLANYLGDWAGFLYPAVDWAGLELLMFGALFALLLVGHFQLITEWSRGKQWKIATVTTGILITVIGILGQSDAIASQERDATITVPLKPLSANLVPTTSVDQFFRSARSLQRDVDDLVGDEAEPDSTVAKPEVDTVGGTPPADGSKD